MSSFYNIGEKKDRPGVYKQYDKAGESEIPGAVYGVFAYPVHADNGPVNTVTTFTKDDIEDFKAMSEQAVQPMVYLHCLTVVQPRSLYTV